MKLVPLSPMLQDAHASGRSQYNEIADKGTAERGSYAMFAQNISLSSDDGGSRKINDSQMPPNDTKRFFPWEKPQWLANAAFSHHRYRMAIWPCWGIGASVASDFLLFFQKSMASTLSSPRSSSYANRIYNQVSQVKTQLESLHIPRAYCCEAFEYSCEARYVPHHFRCSAAR